MNIYITKPAFDFIKTLNFREAHEEKYLYFLSLLSNNNEFRNLSSSVLQAALGKNKHSNGLTYRTIITNLIKEAIIVCDNHYISGKKNFGYIITKPYYSSTKVKYTLKNKRLANKIELATSSKFERLSEHVKQMKINLSELTLNGESVGTRNVIRGNTGRVFNYLTSTKRIDRKQLLWNNTEHIVELDLSAAQPYFLGLMVAAGMQFSSIDECLPDDLRHYLDLTSTGTIYQYFADKLKIDVSDAGAKDKFKKKFYNTYFFNTKYAVVVNSPVGAIFKADFPSIHQFVIDKYINTGKTLSFDLQKFESVFVVDTLYKTLVDRGIWSATIHDAIICKESDADAVYSIFKGFVDSNISPCPIKKNTWDSFCPTPSIKNTLGQLKSITPAKGDSSSTILCYPFSGISGQGVGQNKNDETKDKNRDTIYNTLMNWDFDTNGKITIRKVADVTNLAKKTIEKNWSSFKDIAESINQEHKNAREYIM